MNKSKKKKMILINVILLIIMHIFIFGYIFTRINSHEPEPSEPCNSFSTEECPTSCVVCPPCEECSSISCQSEEFCASIGFNRTWYEDIEKAQREYNPNP